MGEWISVKERLPERLQSVLCYATGDKEHWLQIIMYMYCNNEWCLDYEVSHWMSLPEPPKVDDN